MNRSDCAENPFDSRAQFFGFGYFALAAVSVAAVAAAFFAAASDLEYKTKLIVFAAILLAYPALVCAAYFLQKRKIDRLKSEAARAASENLFNSEIENRLQALEDAREFFGASLKAADMFRLCASRVNEIIPFAACALFLADERGERLRAAFAVGANHERFKDVEIEPDEGVAGRAFSSGKIERDENLICEKSAILPAALRGLKSALAVPLARGANAFGALVLYGDAEKRFDEKSLKLAEAVGERVAPLFLSSFAFERNVANALTDALTSLPNERAFYLVLENQIAESQRFRDERPLTVLTADIKNFAELNARFGHVAGDRILAFAAGIIKDQLRQMDFLARAGSDEFAVVLPTATEAVATEIVERIERAFAQKPFEIARAEKIHLELNFGAATFWRDGETAAALLQTARVKKSQTKAPVKNSVLWFPKEFVN